MRALLLVLALAVPMLAACGDDSGSADPDPTASSAPTTSGDTGAVDEASGTCTYTKEGSAAKEAELPPSEPVAVDSLTITTNRGALGLTLDAEAAPCTVNSFVSLAQQGYFDGTKCHRLVPGFVLQCGDPSATGTGGPGYSFEDELTGEETYPAGTLAMANAGPDTNGSQFFIVLSDAQLPPDYTVFGTVDDAGLKVAREIEKGGNGPDGVAPAKDVVIEKVS